MSYIKTIAGTSAFRTIAILGATIAMAFAFYIPNVDAQTTEADARRATGLEEVQNTIGLGSRDLRETAAAIINVALSLLGIIAVVVVVIGGFFWMTAGGNEEQVTKAKGWIFSGIIGLAIILSAFAISKFVIEQIGKETGLRDL